MQQSLCGEKEWMRAKSWLDIGSMRNSKFEIGDTYGVPLCLASALCGNDYTIALLFLLSVQHQEISRLDRFDANSIDADAVDSHFAEIYLEGNL